MDSTTVVALAGIAGTLAGTLAGTYGTVSSAKITSRTQIRAEEQEARRKAYSACATALISWQYGANLLMISLQRAAEAGAPRFDQKAAIAALVDLEEQRNAVALAIGGVAIEGPYEVSQNARSATSVMEKAIYTMRTWIQDELSSKVPQLEIGTIIREGASIRVHMRMAVDAYSGMCESMLHFEERQKSGNGSPLRPIKRIAHKMKRREQE